MVIDSSAILALLLNEPSAAALMEQLEADPDRRVSAATVVECGIVLQARRGEIAAHQLDVFLQRFGVVVEPFTATHADIAREAWRRFGKGRHAAQLNFGDCLTYALAADLGQAVLHTGADFSHTDIASLRF